MTLHNLLGSVLSLLIPHLAPYVPVTMNDSHFPECTTGCLVAPPLVLTQLLPPKMFSALLSRPLFYNLL